MTGQARDEVEEVLLCSVNEISNSCLQDRRSASKHGSSTGDESWPGLLDRAVHMSHGLQRNVLRGI